MTDGTYTYRLPPERDLARELDVGSTVISYALRVLKAEGLLTAQPPRGTFLANPAPGHAEKHTTAEAAAILRVSLKTVRRLIRDGEIRAQVVGRGFEIDGADLRSYAAPGGRSVQPTESQE